MVATSESVELGDGLERLGKGPISNIPYMSQKFFEREKTIWQESWLSVGRVKDLVKPGDYITFDIKVVHASIFIIMGKDKRLRGFRNICTHRGNKLLCESACSGNTKRLRCRFHSWTFDIDGSLLGVPEAHLFAGLNKKDLGLIPISVDTWGGFIFVNLSLTPKHSLEQWLEGIPDSLADYLGQGSWEWYTGYKGLSRTNWKHITNGAHDGYHGGSLHKDSLPELNPLPHEHCRNVVFPDSPGLSSLLSISHPLEPGNPRIANSHLRNLLLARSFSMLGPKGGEAQLDKKFSKATNQLGSERWIFDMYTIFPNHVMLVLRDMMYVFRAWPIDINTVHWEFNWFFNGPTEKFSDKLLREHAHFDAMWALTEDFPVGEWQQENLLSGALPQSWVGADMEATVRAFQEKLLMHLGMTEENLHDYA